MHLPPVSHSPQVGEKTVPHSDSVYRLREAMLAATEGENSPALEEVSRGEYLAKILAKTCWHFL